MSFQSRAVATIRGVSISIGFVNTPEIIPTLELLTGYLLGRRTMAAE